VPALTVLADPSYLAHLREAWAYVTLGASSILTEELGPMLGGFAAEQGHLGFVRVVVACTVGVWTAEALLYALGRWRAGWVRLKLRRSPPVVKRMLRSMRSAPWRCTFAARFVLGGRIALPLACGAAHVPIWIFLTGTAIASAIWSTVCVTLGWFFGESAMLALGHVRKYEDALAVLLVALAVAAFFWIRRRQRRLIAAEPVDGAE
jgi:membrane protein DedA with SNARE-associated domain